MPRIMTAVLRLLVPTSPTMGRIRISVRKSYSIPFFLFSRLLMTLARNKITAGFANSDG